MFGRKLNIIKKRNTEAGFSLLETLVALVILAIVAVVFMNGYTTNASAIDSADERATAESLARSQLEWVKATDYSYNVTSYTPIDIMDASDYIGYSVNITALSLHDPDDGLQKITIDIYRNEEAVYTLQGYKVDR